MSKNQNSSPKNDSNQQQNESNTLKAPVVMQPMNFTYEQKPYKLNLKKKEKKPEFVVKNEEEEQQQKSSKTTQVKIEETGDNFISLPKPMETETIQKPKNKSIPPNQEDQSNQVDFKQGNIQPEHNENSQSETAHDQSGPVTSDFTQTHTSNQQESTTKAQSQPTQKTKSQNSQEQMDIENNQGQDDPSNQTDNQQGGNQQDQGHPIEQSQILQYQCKTAKSNIQTPIDLNDQEDIQPENNQNQNSQNISNQQQQSNEEQNIKQAQDQDVYYLRSFLPQKDNNFITISSSATQNSQEQQDNQAQNENQVSRTLEEDKIVNQHGDQVPGSAQFPGPQDSVDQQLDAIDKIQNYANQKIQEALNAIQEKQTSQNQEQQNNQQNDLMEEENQTQSQFQAQDQTNVKVQEYKQQQQQSQRTLEEDEKSQTQQEIMTQQLQSQQQVNQMDEGNEKLFTENQNLQSNKQNDKKNKSSDSVDLQQDQKPVLNISKDQEIPQNTSDEKKKETQKKKSKDQNTLEMQNKSDRQEEEFKQVNIKTKDYHKNIENQAYTLPINKKLDNVQEFECSIKPAKNKDTMQTSLDSHFEKKFSDSQRVQIQNNQRNRIQYIDNQDDDTFEDEFGRRDPQNQSSGKKQNKCNKKLDQQKEQLKQNAQLIDIESGDASQQINQYTQQQYEEQDQPTQQPSAQVAKKQKKIVGKSTVNNEAYQTKKIKKSSQYEADICSLTPEQINNIRTNNQSSIDKTSYDAYMQQKSEEIELRSFVLAVSDSEDEQKIKKLDSKQVQDLKQQQNFIQEEAKLAVNLIEFYNKNPETNQFAIQKINYEAFQSIFKRKAGKDYQHFRKQLNYRLSERIKVALTNIISIVESDTGKNYNMKSQIMVSLINIYEQIQKRLTNLPLLISDFCSSCHDYTLNQIWDQVAKNLLKDLLIQKNISKVLSMGTLIYILELSEKIDVIKKNINLQKKQTKIQKKSGVFEEFSSIKIKNKKVQFEYEVDDQTQQENYRREQARISEKRRLSTIISSTPRKDIQERIAICNPQSIHSREIKRIFNEKGVVFCNQSIMRLQNKITKFGFVFCDDGIETPHGQILSFWNQNIQAYEQEMNIKIMFQMQIVPLQNVVERFLMLTEHEIITRNIVLSHMLQMDLYPRNYNAIMSLFINFFNQDQNSFYFNQVKCNLQEYRQYFQICRLDDTNELSDEIDESHISGREKFNILTQKVDVRLYYSDVQSKMLRVIWINTEHKQIQQTLKNILIESYPPRLQNLIKNITTCIIDHQSFKQEFQNYLQDAVTASNLPHSEESIFCYQAFIIIKLLYYNIYPEIKVTDTKKNKFIIAALGNKKFIRYGNYEYKHDEILYLDTFNVTYIKYTFHKIIEPKILDGNIVQWIVDNKCDYLNIELDTEDRNRFTSQADCIKEHFSVNPYVDNSATIKQNINSFLLAVESKYVQRFGSQYIWSQVSLREKEQIQIKNKIKNNFETFLIDVEKGVQQAKELNQLAQFIQKQFVDAQRQEILTNFTQQKYKFGDNTGDTIDELARMHNLQPEYLQFEINKAKRAKIFKNFRKINLKDENLFQQEYKTISSAMYAERFADMSGPGFNFQQDNGVNCNYYDIMKTNYQTDEEMTEPMRKLVENCYMHRDDTIPQDTMSQIEMD